MKVEVFQWQVIAKRMKINAPDVETAKRCAEMGDFDQNFRYIQRCFLDQSYEAVPLEEPNDKS